MKHLHLLRHAKSSWKDRSLPDEQRPLAPRGVRASARMAEHIAQAELSVELVACSPARRARDTLEAIRPALGPNVEVRTEPALYGAGPDDLLDFVRELPEEVDCALLVGHNPGLQSFALRLAASGQEVDTLAAKYPTGALASLALEIESWREAAFGGAMLESFVRPRELR